MQFHIFSKYKLSIRHTLAFFLVSSTFALTGCKGLPSAGHYEGTLFIDPRWETSAEKIDPRDLVSIDISEEKKNTGMIQIYGVKKDKTSSIDPAPLMSLQFSEFNSKGFLLKVLDTPFKGESFKLKKTPRSSKFVIMTCYSNTQDRESSSSYKVEVCWDHREFQLTIRDKDQNPLYLVTAGKFDRQGPFEYEDKTSLKLSTAVETALDKSFGSKIEFERLIQAEKKAEIAYKNLLPHIRARTILGIASLSVLTVVGTLGDLTPFLFPNRWLQAKASSIQAEIQKHTYLIMQAQLARQVENLSYALIQHQASAKIYEAAIQRAATVLDDIRFLEKMNLIEKGSSLTFQVMIKRMNKSWVEIEREIFNDKAAISQSLGFLNPEAVDQIELDREPRFITEALPLDSLKAITLAGSQSLSVKQLDLIIQYLRTKKIEAAFTWLDPSESLPNGIGFNLPPAFEHLGSEVEAAKYEQNKRRTEVFSRAEVAVNNYNALIKEYKLNQEAKELQESLLNEQILKLQAAKENHQFTDVRAHEMKSLLKEHLKISLELEDDLANFRMARTEIQQLTLVEQYKKLKWENLEVNSIRQLEAQ